MRFNFLVTIDILVCHYSDQSYSLPLAYCVVNKLRYMISVIQTFTYSRVYLRVHHKQKITTNKAFKPPGTVINYALILHTHTTLGQETRWPLDMYPGGLIQCTEIVLSHVENYVPK